MRKRLRAWHTPNSLTGDEICRPLFLPANEEILALVGGALSELTKLYNWEQVGEVTPAQATEFFTVVLQRWYGESCGGAVDEIPTPFWDEVTDTDDTYPTETQPWYGYVLDPDLPPGELTFVEDATIWVITGMLAVGASPAAAILFQTIAPSFAIAMRGGDVAEVIRILVDGEEAATITTSGDSDELIEVPVYPDPGVSLHDILIVLQEILP